MKPTVWISRPPHRALHLQHALAANGVHALLLPAMHIEDLADESSLSAYLAEAENFAVSIFVSREAAERVAARLPAGAALPALAIGEATAAALPPRYRLLAAAEEIGDSCTLLQSPVLQHCRGRVAVLGGTDAANTPPSPPLLGALRARGDTVLPVICYRRIAAAADAQLMQRGNSGEVHGAVAYSSDSLRHMLQMTAPHNAWLKRLPLFVIHANIAASAREFGFDEVLCAPSSELAQVIARRLHLTVSS